MTYHKVGEDNVVSNDNLVMLGVLGPRPEAGPTGQMTRHKTLEGVLHERVLRSYGLIRRIGSTGKGT